MPMNIAIDGPVGAGKSSIADAVAARLGILHLDTGAMYRALALNVLRSGISLEDETAVTACCEAAKVAVKYENGAQRTFLFDEDVSGLIRTGEVSAAASSVSKWAGVRSLMVRAQQELAKTADMLIDGRDIGTGSRKDTCDGLAGKAWTGWYGPYRPGRYEAWFRRGKPERYGL